MSKIAQIVKNLSIRKKLILIILLVSLFALFFSLLLVMITNIIGLKDDLKNNTIINARLIGEYCAVPLAFDVKENAAETLEKLKAIPSVEIGIVYNEKNEVFASFFKHKNDSSILEVPSNRQMSEYVDHNLHVFQPISYDGKVSGTIYLKVSTDSLMQKEHLYTMYSLIIFAVVMVVSYFLALGFQPIISRPIRKLTEATRGISEKGDYAVRVEKSGNDEIGILVDEYNKMLEQIQLREESLKQRTIELSETLSDLQRMQGKLVESEKMAALGQLIAGVAHEVNTPLGAIRSSVGNITNSLETILHELPLFIQSLSNTQRELFFDLVKYALDSQKITTSKEERKIKKEIVASFETRQIPHADSLADTLVDMGVYENTEKFDPILKDERSETILKMAYKLTGLQRSTQNITVATDKASKVVFALKNFAHIDQTDEMLRSNILDGIETVLTLYYNQLKHGVEVTRDFKEIPHINCYPDELNQVWTNLLHNSLQAMQYKGKIHIAAHIKNEFVVVSLTDNGCGIPSEIKERIFQPFFTTKAAGEGTGLGLDIVKRIVEKHNGKIELESQPGKTTFSIYLPINLEIN